MACDWRHTICRLRWTLHASLMCSALCACKVVQHAPQHVVTAVSVSASELHHLDQTIVTTTTTTQLYPDGAAGVNSAIAIMTFAKPAIHFRQSMTQRREPGSQLSRSQEATRNTTIVTPNNTHRRQCGSAQSIQVIKQQDGEQQCNHQPVHGCLRYLSNRNVAAKNATSSTVSHHTSPQNAPG